MKHRTLWIAVVLLPLASVSASAQSMLDGVYITKPLRDRLAGLMVERFSSLAPQAGFTPTERQPVRDTIRKGELNYVPRRPDVLGWFTLPPSVKTESGLVALNSLEKQKLMGGLFNLGNYQAFFSKYATVTLRVHPIPPRDYQVVINGEACPATARSIYKVPAGHTTVSVSRDGKPPCRWAGEVPRGVEKTVECRL